MVRKFAIFVVSCYVYLFYGHRVYGKKNIPKEGGGIVASNHSSYIDPPLIGISYPGEVHFLARATLFNRPFFAWLIGQLNTHPVAKGKENVSTFKLAVELIMSGKKIVLFPEGTRSEDGELKAGQLGVGMLVMRTKCFVIPAYVHGSYEIWGKHRKLPKLTGQKTAVVFGSPLHFSEEGVQDKKEWQQHCTDQIMEAIKNLRTWYNVGHKGNPP